MTTPKRPDLPELERDFQKAVIDLARVLGYRVAHFRPARTSKGWATPVGADGKGYPDLTLVGNGRVIFAELKAEAGSLRAEQKEWVAALEANGAEVYVWKPSQWDELVGILRNRRLLAA